MFFKRSQPEAAKPETDGTSQKVSVTPLPVAELRHNVDPATLGFATTAELEPISGLIGQERALKAIQFGANMRSNDFNVFVLGPPASGKSTAVKQYLTRKAGEESPPGDWVYVNNFEDPNRPRAIQLPTGRAKPLAKPMIGFIDDLEIKKRLDNVFDGDDARGPSILVTHDG